MMTTTTASPDSSRDSTQLGRIMRMATFVVVALATMELLARVDDHVQYDAPLSGNYEFDRLFSFDGKVVRGTPGARYMKWSMNDMGLRGPDPDLSKPHQRIVVYGASEVFGMYESDGQDFPRRLEADLRTRFPGQSLEVVNAGIPGMRIGSGSEYLHELGERLKPSIVVLYPTPTHYLGVTQPNCGRPERSAGGASTGAGLPRSRLLAKATDRLKEALPKSWLNQARRAAIAWATRGQEAINTVDPESLSALDKDLHCAIRAVRSIGAQPVLVTHASRFATTPAPDDAYWLTGWRQQYPPYAQSTLLTLERDANAIIAAAARAEQIPLIDASSELGGRPALFADHAHFNDQGAARMGQLLADATAPLLASK